MGVPVLTLAGAVHAGRVGASLLTCVGLDDWVAGSQQELLEKSVAFAADLGGLAGLRKDLRDRLVTSRLCKPDDFAHSLEQAYRAMWAKWCADSSNGVSPTTSSGQ
jgi:predicted O-linked N-acetylglucosamine transferase (SPINDLY family)